MAKKVSQFWNASFPFKPNKIPFFYGWIIIFWGTIGIIASIPGQTMGVGVFTDSLLEVLSMNRTQLSQTYLLGTICSGLLLPKSGRIYDLLGARKMMTFCSATFAISILLMSQVDRIGNYFNQIFLLKTPAIGMFAAASLCFFLLRFFGQGLLTMSSRNLMAKWFDLKRGIALGTSGLFVSALFSISPKFLDQLIYHYNWRVTWITLAICIGIIMTLGSWLIARDNPEECDLQMDGGLQAKRKTKNLDMLLHKEYNRKEALHTYSFWFFNLSLSWQSLFGTAYIFHLTSIASSIHIEKTEIFWFLVPAAFIGVISNFCAGWASAHIRIKYFGCLHSLGIALASLGLIQENKLALSILLILGHGLSQGMFGMLSGIVWSRFFGRKYLGSITGIHMSTIVIASAMGPWLFSFSYDLTGSYSFIMKVAISISACFFLAAFFADNPQRKLKANALNHEPS